jgi:hypothetical protein
MKVSVALLVITLFLLHIKPQVCDVILPYVHLSLLYSHFSTVVAAAAVALLHFMVHCSALIHVTEVLVRAAARPYNSIDVYLSPTQPLS